MKIRYRFAIALLSVILGSCVSQKVIKNEKLTAVDVLRRVEERNAAIHSLSGRGNISVKSPELSNSGAFIVTMKQPDSLLLSLHGPFGIHVGTLALTRNTFYYYNGLENNLLEGTPDSSTLLSILHFTMPVHDILGSLTGAFPMIQDSLLRFSSTEDEYLMAYSHAGKTIEYRIDASTFVVTNYLIKNRDDKVLLEAEMSRITTSADLATPQSVSISFPESRRSIVLVYKQLSLNEDVSCSFDVPDGVKVIKR